MNTSIHRSIQLMSEKWRSKGMKVALSTLLVTGIGGGLGVPQQAVAAPTYSISKVLVAGDQWQGEPGLVPKKLYKPHEVAVDAGRGIWVSSNERTGKAGITIFRDQANKVFATINIDEPGVVFHEEDEEETIGNEDETTGDPNFPDDVRMNPSVCLPVQLPRNIPRPDLNGIKASWFDRDKRIICAPLGAESHPRHPHGIDIDKQRNLVHQVIEHSGLRWSAKRRVFKVADNTDEESGLLLIYDIKNVRNPKIVNGYLLGHGAHELAVNENDGRVWQGNHEDSPGVKPTIWVDVIDPSLGNNGYGFIDTGYYNAVQGIEVEEGLNQVFGTTHVGEKMFAFDGGCVPAPNAAPDDEKQMGENCILYSVDLLAPFFDQIPEAQQIFDIANTEIIEAIANGEEPPVLPAVLHMHDLTVGVDGGIRAYQTLHSIHHAEHTGSPEEAALPVIPEPPPGQEPPEEPEHHFMGRWLAEVHVDPADSRFKQVTYIDLSNGMNILDVPNVEDIPAGTPYEDQFVHAHWVATDPDRRAVLVTGEHTGNLGVVNRGARTLKQVLPISERILNCTPPLDEDGNPEAEEPHVHGVQLNSLTGTLYVSDEGEHCFYESVTKLTPN